MKSEDIAHFSKILAESPSKANQRARAKSVGQDQGFTKGHAAHSSRGSTTQSKEPAPGLPEFRRTGGAFFGEGKYPRLMRSTSGLGFDDEDSENEEVAVAGDNRNEIYHGMYRKPTFMSLRGREDKKIETEVSREWEKVDEGEMRPGSGWKNIAIEGEWGGGGWL
jgi:hypothetical protein